MTRVTKNDQDTQKLKAEYARVQYKWGGVRVSTYIYYFVPKLELIIYQVFSEFGKTNCTGIVYCCTAGIIKTTGIEWGVPDVVVVASGRRVETGDVETGRPRRQPSAIPYPCLVGFTAYYVPGIYNNSKYEIQRVVSYGHTIGNCGVPGTRGGWCTTDLQHQ